MENLKNIPNVLNKLMNTYNCNQKELADRIGVSESAISTWMSGRRNPRPDQMDAICKAFGITNNELYGLINPSDTNKCNAVCVYDYSTIKSSKDFEDKNVEFIIELPLYMLNKDTNYFGIANNQGDIYIFKPYIKNLDISYKTVCYLTGKSLTIESLGYYDSNTSNKSKKYLGVCVASIKKY